MATSSFEQKFFVSDENIDTFIKVVTEPLSSGNKGGFNSHAINGDELKQYLRGISKKNDGLYSCPTKWWYWAIW